MDAATALLLAIADVLLNDKHPIQREVKLAIVRQCRDVLKSEIAAVDRGEEFLR